jgi:hypothetical protein
VTPRNLFHTAPAASLATSQIPQNPTSGCPRLIHEIAAMNTKAAPIQYKASITQLLAPSGTPKQTTLTPAAKLNALEVSSMTHPRDFGGLA